MPLYEYGCPETGATIEMMRPVEDRNLPVVIDGATYQRTKLIPDTLLVFGAQPTEAESFDATVLKGYYRQEEQQGSRFRSSYSKKTLSRVFDHARKLT